jgi:hypothetical protein
MTRIGVASIKDLDDYLAWGSSLGVTKFIFRTCSPIPTEYSQQSGFSTFNKENWINIRPIIEEFLTRTEWTRIFSQEKTDSFLHVFRSERGTIIDLDESSEEIDPDPKVRRLILMPDGHTYTSWLDNRARLFENPLEINTFDFDVHRALTDVQPSDETLAVLRYGRRFA